MNKKRFIELDLLRTLAIVMMVIYHTAFDLYAYYDFNINPYIGWWWLLARSTAILFLLLVGISFVISWERTTQALAPAQALFKYLKRGLLIFLCGILITIVTYFWDPNTYIRFGILHMIGVSIMLLPLFRKLREWNLLIATLIICLGISVIPNFQFSIFNFQFLLPLGITPPFTTLDYFPLLPWFGIILTGLALGDFFYISNCKTPKETNKFFTIISFPGRHALIVYLTHQPLIIAILAILHI